MTRQVRLRKCSPVLRAGQWTVLGLLAIGLTTGPGSSSGDTLDSFAIPPALRGAVTRLHPGAEIVSKRQVYVGCAPLRDQIFSGDFNGDGLVDYAVLLRIGRSAGQREKGQDTSQLWLVAFMAKPDGSFRAITLERVTLGIPSPISIAVQVPGLVKHWEDPARNVTLSRDGIARFYCGKSSSVFYWSEKNHGFLEIDTGD